jgi:pyridoxine 5'-phosphate synthase PdxJ
MTEGQQSQMEKDILYAIHVVEKEDQALRIKLSVIRQHLESLGQALQHHPEDVTPLPEPQNDYDYREGLNILGDRQRVVNLCKELRSVEQRVKAAKQRKELFRS